MHKNLFIIIVLLLISISAVQAVTQFKTTITPEFYELVNLEERAEFTLEIENLESEPRHFRANQLDPHWFIQSEPTSHWTSGITVPPRTSVYTKLLVKPIGIDTGRYKIILNIRPKDEPVMKKEELIISIPEPSSRIYQPAIRTTVEVDEEIDPREPLKVNIRIKNQNPLDIKQLRVIVRSDSKEGEVLLNEETITTLSPVGQSGDQKDIVITKTLDERMSPTQDTIRVSLFYNDELVEPTIPPQDIKIIRYTEIIPQQEIKKSFLKKVGSYSYVNDGNAENSETIRIETGWFEKIFTKTSVGVRLVDDETGSFFVYDVSLNPDESTTFWISTSYRFPASIILIILLIILGYFIFRSPLLVYKEVKAVHKKSDGTSEVKVQLHIKNRSAITLEEVRILDKVPPIAGLKKVFHIGTLEPTKIAEHDKSGTTVKWEVDEIERFEERLIVYKIHTKFAVLGGFNLPPVVVRFKTPRGEIRRVRSKPLQVKIE